MGAGVGAGVGVGVVVGAGAGVVAAGAGAVVLAGAVVVLDDFDDVDFFVVVVFFVCAKAVPDNANVETVTRAVMREKFIVCSKK